MRIWHKLGADESIVPLEKALLLRQLVEIVRSVLDVAVGGDKEACRARCGVLHNLTGLRLHLANDAIDQRARSKILTRSRFLVGSVLFKQSLIKIAETVVACGEPIQLIDAGGQS